MPDTPVVEVQRNTYGGDGAIAQLRVGQFAFDIPIFPLALHGNDAPFAIAVGARLSVRVAPSRVRIFRR
jgi:hypothetical protein